MDTNEFTTALIIGFDKRDDDKAVLIVGRQDEKHNVQIINAFQGEEAIDIYNILITKKAQNKEVTDNVSEEL